MSTTNSDTNALGMSDEDFMNAPLPSADSQESSKEAADAALGSTEVTEETQSDDEANEAEDLGDSEDEPGKDEDLGDQAEEGLEGDKSSVSSDTETQDFKAFYEKITAKFKANGKEMQVDSPDDIIQLMQMGANYSKKMAGLKPALKTLKVLEKHGLVGEEKLGFLIDLHNKNPGAIKRLLKDSPIDLLDIDTEDDNSYQPTRYQVNDQELALDDVVQEIKDSPTYNQTIEIVSNVWDESSRQAIATTPALLSVINEHVSNGVYERVWTEVERERMLGRLSGMSDFDAYRTVGDRIFGQEGEPSTAEEKTVISRKKVGESDQSRTKKKQAASPSRSTTSKSTGQDFNPLALSDDEFMKTINSKFV